MIMRKQFQITVTGLLAEGDDEAQQVDDVQGAGRALVAVLRDGGLVISSAGLTVATPGLEAHHLPAQSEAVDLLAEEEAGHTVKSSPSPQPSPHAELASLRQQLKASGEVVMMSTGGKAVPVPVEGVERAVT